MKAGTEEPAKSDAASFSEELCPDELEQVRTIRTDNPGRAQWEALSAVCRNLYLMSEDTVHICMIYEQCHYNQSTLGSKMLRAIMDMFNKVDPNLPLEALGPVFKVDNPPELSVMERAMRDIIKLSLIHI